MFEVRLYGTFAIRLQYPETGSNLDMLGEFVLGTWTSYNEVENCR